MVPQITKQVPPLATISVLPVKRYNLHGAEQDLTDRNIMVSVITAYPLWVVMWSPVSYCKWRYLVRKLTSNRLLNHARRVDVCLTGRGMLQRIWDLDLCPWSL